MYTHYNNELRVFDSKRGAVNAIDLAINFSFKKSDQSKFTSLRDRSCAWVLVEYTSRGPLKVMCVWMWLVWAVTNENFDQSVLQLDWSRISGNIIELSSVNYSRTYIMLHIVVNVRNRRLRFAYPPNPKLIFWISNNPRPSNLYVLTFKKIWGIVKT